VPGSVCLSVCQNLQLLNFSYMENLMVIRVEVIAPEKPLDVNTSSKNIAHVDSIICKRPKISSVLIWSVAIAKNTYVDLGLSVRTKIKSA
jgi:hypothetical protein